MSSQDLIRLRVSVQRHGVPEVKLIWPCARSHDLTVSKFLSQINEVMPLESGEWGLEDYVVELADGTGGSYECLHFQPVPHILKNDDHILIRCLHGEDLKRRRLSGRHQISADGRHLVDGLVFGRPWLRTPRDRPALDLPPRKRARTARDCGGNYDFDDQDELPDTPQPRLLLERAQQDMSSDDMLAEGSDDSDEYLDEEFDEDLDEELEQGLDKKCDEDVDEEFDDASGEDQDEVAEELGHLRNDNMAVGHVMPANGPGNTSDGQVIEAPAPTANGLDLGALDGIVALRAAFPQTPVIAIEAELLRQHKDLRKAYDALSGSHEPALGFDDVMANAVIRLFFPGHQPSSGSPDHQSARQMSITSRPLIQVVESSDGPEDAAVAMAPPDTHPPLGAGTDQGLRDSSTGEDADRGTENTEYTASDIGASDDTSSDGTDSSSDLSSSSDDDESSSDESDSDSDSSEDNLGAPIGTQSSHDDESSSDSSSSDGSESDFDLSNDGTGASVSRQATQNTCREGAQGHKEASDVPPGAPSGRTKTQKRNARRRRSMARISADKRRIDDEVDLAKDSQHVQATQDDDGAEETKNGDAPSTTPDRRRSRVDLGAGRRLLFGSLGLKAPKTRADEEKIKQGLMKDVRPLNNMRLTEGQKASEDASVASGCDIEDWRQRVTYRAVECSHQGMVLSEPPFPFEQRWDPQQRGRACRKRKRTSQEFVEDWYGDDDSGLYMEEDVGQTKRIKSLMSDHFGLGAVGEDEAPGKTPSSETEGRNAAGTTAQADDVPSLPADVGSLADLEAGGAKDGMVITWKQIVMSKATRWQPMVVQQTGTVLRGSDETNLYVLLAMRDREDRSKMFDEAGKRIYDKFEMPDADSGDEGEDDGERMVSWAEMTEPKIVRMPEEK
ncbi:transcription factor atf21 [Hirsutella rhossiliensis]|uniref:Transcription factor atf21 n=1 Tax=Hirsutella rhossiliensis TaxID=111463 RepID=A0A9P8MNB2_9HYPO|nr:transcription factor atf21 [Hirsutella rhossiliensis]KAH0958117.1 transcription factor atf21 [Hirsutella rhossiliensis]